MSDSSERSDCARYTPTLQHSTPPMNENWLSAMPHGEDTLQALQAILVLFSPPTPPLLPGGAPPLAQGRTRLLHPSASSALTSLSPQTRRSGACGWRPRVDGGALRQNSSTTLRPGQPNLVRIPRPCGYTARTLRRRRSTTAVATNSSNRMTSPQMSPMHVAERSACGHASHRRELLYAVVP